jgi:hypothetical protein
MKILIVITTLYGMREPNYLVESMKHLVKQCENSKHECEIIVAGREVPDFHRYENKYIKKEYLYKRKGYDIYNTTDYWNEKIDQIGNNDYICLFHDDLFIDDNNWINKFVDIFKMKELKCGVLGIISHSNSVIRQYRHELYQCLYTNGALFTSGKIAKEIKFNGTYLYECTDMEFCYESVYRGYRNYIVCMPYRHYITPYDNTFKLVENLREKLIDDRKKFNAKWSIKLSREVLRNL